MSFKKTLIAGCATAAAALSPGAGAQEFGWRDANGKATPDTESRKSSQGFAGWLLTTSDADWQAKWDTPEHETPGFTEAKTVRMGQTIFTLIFVVNPKAGTNGEVEVRCDLKITRPNGSVSTDEKDVECLKGVLQGGQYNMRLAEPVLGFIGEATDPLGTWHVDVTLRDVPRGVTMGLHTSFELVGDAEQKAK